MTPHVLTYLAWLALPFLDDRHRWPEGWAVIWASGAGALVWLPVIELIVSILP